MVDLTLSQIRAIYAQIDLGRILQIDFSFDLAERWINGETIQEIALCNKIIPERYNVTQRIAIEGVRKYLCGHNGSMGIKPYDGMVPEEQRKKICRDHRTSSEVMPLELRISNGKKIAQKMGYTTWLTENELGIAEKDLAIALTHSEVYRISEPKRGFRIGDINNQAITDTLNSERVWRGYEPIVTVDRVRKGLYKYRKKLEKRNNN